MTQVARFSNRSRRLLLVAVPWLVGGLMCPLASVSAADPPIDPIGRPPVLAKPIEIDARLLAVPTPVQAAWHDLEVGMFIHLAPQTWQDNESDQQSTPLSAINPDKLDTDEWVKVAQSMGAKYIVFVAKHEGGFCWWPTSTTEHNVSKTPWRGGKGDVLKDLAESCRRGRIQLGVYLSPQDKKHDIAGGGKASDPVAQSQYELLFRTQLTEVLSNYGEMCEVWFDGSLVFDVGDILEEHAKNAVIFQGPQATIRWVGNEDGVAPELAWSAVKTGVKRWGDYTGADSDPLGDAWLPIECDARIRSTWFWRTDNEKTLKTVPQLVEMYEHSVGRGAVLLLNQTPDRSGRIPAADARRAGEFGAAIGKTYATAKGDTSGTGNAYTVQPSAPVVVDRVVLMEDITQGERVQGFVLEARVDGQWTAIAEGQAIGRKRIVAIEPLMVEAVRLKITASLAQPIIRRFALHSTGAKPGRSKPEKKP